jgi:hypothetical protein
MDLANLVLFGVFGVIGSVIALRQLQQGGRLARLEVDKHAAEEALERRAQAIQVACWTVSGTSDKGQGKVVLHLLNAGSQPIFQVHVLVRPYYQAYEPAGVSEVGDGHFLGSLGRGAEVCWDVEIRSDRQEVSHLSGSLPIEVAFLDVSRRQWRRTVQGQLEELREHPGGFC